MKSKFLYICCAVFCIMMSAFLFACNEEPQYFDVSVNVWYFNYGTAYGGGTFEENTTCTIYATEKQDSKFMAWMHDDVIVSYEPTYSFTVTNKTRGIYTAIFTLPNMELVTPKTITLNNGTTSDFTINSINLTLKMGSSFSSLHELVNADAVQNNQFSVTEPVMALNKNNATVVAEVMTFIPNKNKSFFNDNEVVKLDNDTCDVISKEEYKQMKINTQYSMRYQAPEPIQTVISEYNSYYNVSKSIDTTPTYVTISTDDNYSKSSIRHFKSCDDECERDYCLINDYEGGIKHFQDWDNTNNNNLYKLY